MDVTGNTAEYIDVDGALKRVGGNMDLYKRLLGRFSAGSDYQTLSEALESGNMEEAARLAHTIKGVTSNLSLMKIAGLSIQLEQLIKSGSSFESCLEELKQAFETTNSIIAEMTQ